MLQTSLHRKNFLNSNNIIVKNPSIILYPRKEFRLFPIFPPTKSQIQYFIEDVGLQIKLCGLTFGISILSSKLLFSDILVPFYFILFMWVPSMMACNRNLPTMQFQYFGIWHCKVLKVSELKKPQTFKENGLSCLTFKKKSKRETNRCFNVIFGDQTGNETEVIVFWNKDCLLIEKGETAYLIALSKSETIYDLRVIDEIYLPDSGIWISDYPYIKRTVFKKIISKIQHM
jgi:hypothetical protein